MHDWDEDAWIGTNILKRKTDIASRDIQVGFDRELKWLRLVLNSFKDLK